MWESNEETNSGRMLTGGAPAHRTQSLRLCNAAELCFSGDSGTRCAQLCKGSWPRQSKESHTPVVFLLSEREGEINLSQQRKTTLLMFIIYQLILFSDQVEMGHLSLTCLSRFKKVQEQSCKKFFNSSGLLKTVFIYSVINIWKGTCFSWGFLNVMSWKEMSGWS